MKIISVKNILSFAVPLFIIIAILAGSYFRILESYELETLDLRFWLRPQMPTTDKVAIIEIGNDTISKLGRFPFDRINHAILIKALTEAGAKAIIFDIFFNEPNKDDEALALAIKESGNVYLPFVFQLEHSRRNSIATASSFEEKELSIFEENLKGSGHINIIPDVDGKYRRVPLYIKYGPKLYPSISFLAACDQLNITQDNIKVVPGKYIELTAGEKIPLDENSNMIVNFSGKWCNTYKHYSYVDIMQSYLVAITSSDSKPILDLSVFKDKLCIIGLTAVGTSDTHPNPFDTLYYAVGIHAEVINSILRKNFITKVSRETNLFILMLLSLAVTLAVLKTKPLKGLIALLALIATFFLFCIILFNYFGIWIDMLYPIVIMAVVYLSCNLYKYMTEWKRRLVLENELQIAKKIQESFLPKEVPSDEKFDIEAVMFNARQVGGDLYDFVKFGDDRLGVMIGDVSGKGVPSSLFMAMTVSAFKTFSTPGSMPEEVLFQLNSKIVKEFSSNLFVTVFYAIFDTKNKILVYANGGHPPLLYLSGGKGYELLDVDEGKPLGLMDGTYSGRQINFKAGDVFIFYTDGVTEAMNSKREMYEVKRLIAAAEKNKNNSAKVIIKNIEKDIRKFEPRQIQHDDMTLIVVKIR